MSDQATVVLVSSPCATIAVWSRVSPLLDAQGVPNVAVQLPSSLPESDEDDASFVRSVLDEYDGPVVLGGHSSSGLVLTEVGEHPSVGHLVYVDAVMWDIDEPWQALISGGVADGWSACVRVRRDVVEYDLDAVAAYLRSRGWASPDVDGFVRAFRPQRHVASVLSLTTAAWRAVPSTFIRPAESEMLRPLQDRFAARASSVIDIGGDHFPHWRRPDEIAGILADVSSRGGRPDALGE